MTDQIKKNFKNETLETIYHRHSARRFLEKPVSDEDVRAILDAANQAPSAHNRQSWRFVVIEGEKKDGLAKLITERSHHFPKPSSAILRMSAKTMLRAPVVIAVTNTGNLIQHGHQLFNIDPEHAGDFFRTMEIQSSAAAVENILLAATSLGIGSVWLGIMFLIKDEVLEYLGEEKGEFMAIIPIGYPDKSLTGPKKKDLDYVLKRL